MQKIIARLLLLFSTACVGPALSRAPASDPIQASGYYWLEYGPNSNLVARAVVDSTTVPIIDIDGIKAPMEKRAAPTGAGLFTENVYEFQIPKNTNEISIDDHALAKPNSAPQKILIIGDTGCRIKKSRKKVQVQKCNDEGKWPFQDLAKAAVAIKPDLIVHVGDYHYREAACPDGDSSCQGSPYGDTYASWNADFFTPAMSLLPVAPWIFVRGNHETCERAHEGFFRFLDPRSLPAACQEVTAPYLVPFENLSLAVLDSAAAEQTADDLKTLNELDLNKSWLVTHRTLYYSEAEGSKDDDDEAEKVKPAATGSVATSKRSIGAPENISLIFTGHKHLFRTMTFADHRPPQITSGNGGTKLEGHPTSYVPGTTVDFGGTTVTSVNEWLKYGFLVMQAESGGWKAIVYDKSGSVVTTCRVITNLNAADDLQCDPFPQAPKPSPTTSVGG